MVCFCWGIDNNFTRNISAKNSFDSVTVKGIIAGSFSLTLSIILKNKMPEFKIVIIAMIIGTVLLLKEEHNHLHSHEHRHIH